MFCPNRSRRATFGARGRCPSRRPAFRWPEVDPPPAGNPKTVQTSLCIFSHVAKTRDIGAITAVHSSTESTAICHTQRRAFLARDGLFSYTAWATFNIGIPPLPVSLSKRVQKVKPSPTLAMTARAAKLKAEGKDIIGLAAGEPDFDTPLHISDAGVEAIRSGLTRYTAVDGTTELKDAIIAKFKRENGLTYERSQILVSSGAKQTCFNVCAALLDPGDECVIPAPYWVSYPDMALLADATPVTIYGGAEQGYKITPAQLAAAITPRTKLFILNSPSNPTGAAYSAAELK